MALKQSIIISGGPMTGKTTLADWLHLNAKIEVYDGVSLEFIKMHATKTINKDKIFVYVTNEPVDLSISEMRRFLIVKLTQL